MTIEDMIANAGIPVSLDKAEYICKGKCKVW